MKTVSKKRCLWLLTGLMTTLLGGAVLAGCTSGGGTTLEDVTGAGFTCIVTFDTAGGHWATGATGGSGSNSGEDGEETETVTRMEARQFYVKPNSLLSDNAIKFAETVRTGYTFNTYWTGVKNADGSVTYGKAWDFATDRVTEDITLYARWMENYSLVAHYGDGFSRSKTFTVAQNSEGVAQPLTSLSFISEGITVLGMYENADKTGEIPAVSSSSPYLAPCTPENRVHHIYVDSIDGNWTLVKEKKDFVVYQNSWIYLLTDLDFEGEEIDLPAIFTGRIEGNNHTVVNFTIKQEMGDRNDRYYGLFKEVRNIVNADTNEVEESAVIQNVTFANVNYSAKLTNTQVIEFGAGVFAGRVDEETTVKNVKVTGTFTFTVASSHYEDTDVTQAIGYELHEVDMSKFEVNITGATVTKELKE